MICNFHIFQMMFHTSGPLADFATSRVAKIVRTSNPRASTDGSGPRIAKRWHQQIRHRTAGATTRGLRPDTRNNVNQTMRNSISTALASLVCQFWTTSTTMASHGTTWRATTRNLSYARTMRNFWIMSQLRTEEYDCKLIFFDSLFISCVYHPVALIFDVILICKSRGYLFFWYTYTVSDFVSRIQ